MTRPDRYTAWYARALAAAIATVPLGGFLILRALGVIR